MTTGQKLLSLLFVVAGLGVLALGAGLDNKALCAAGAGMACMSAGLRFGWQASDDHRRQQMAKKAENGRGF